jgi:hypothetical protein
MVFTYQRESLRIASNRKRSLLQVALEHLVVARLVHDLGGLEELVVGAGDDVHELAAGEHRPLLAVDQHRQPPRGDAPVQLDAVALAQALPQRAAVDVH